LFDPPIQCSIELLASSRDPDATLANLAEFSSSDEAGGSWLFVVSDDDITAINECLTDSFLAASLILSTLTSEKPLIFRSLLVVQANRVCGQSLVILD